MSCRAVLWPVRWQQQGKSVGQLIMNVTPPVPCTLSLGSLGWSLAIGSLTGLEAECLNCVQDIYCSSIRAITIVISGIIIIASDLFVYVCPCEDVPRARHYALQQAA